MTITPRLQIDAFARVTPADALASSTYLLGFASTSFTIPTDADIAITRSFTTASGAGKAYEPDTNTFDSESPAPKDPDGATVDLDSFYLIVLKNTHASLSATFVCANMDSGNWAGTLDPGGIAVLFCPSGVSVGATSTLTLTGVGGAPVVDMLLVGVSN